VTGARAGHWDWMRWAMLATLLVAVLLRVAEAIRSPLWFDEIYILLIVRRPFLDMIHTIAADIHPPFSFLVRWVWSALGGEGALYQKLLGILFALASMVVGYRLGGRLFDRKTSLVALALVAFNLAHIRYSQEIEFFSLAWLLLMLMIQSAWNWIEMRRSRDAVLLVVWCTLATYTEYYLIATVATLGLWGVLALRKDRAALRTWLLCFAIVALMFVPQSLVLADQFMREGAGRYFRFPSIATLRELWRQLDFGMVQLILILAALALLPLLRPGPWRRPASLLWALCVLPLFATRAWVVILPREAFYMITPWMMLAAAGIGTIRSRTAFWTVSVVLVALAGWRARRLNVFPEAVATGQAVEFARERSAPGDLVVHAESHSLLAFLLEMPGARNRLLMEPGHTVPYFDGGLAVPESCYLSPEEWRREREQRRVWWAVRVDRAYATKGTVSRAGAAVAESIAAAHPDSAWSFPPFTVWRGGPMDSRGSPRPR